MHGANMGPTWGRQDPGGPPCWPHEPCYVGAYFNRTGTTFQGVPANTGLILSGEFWSHLKDTYHSSYHLWSSSHQILHEKIIQRVFDKNAFSHNFVNLEYRIRSIGLIVIFLFDLKHKINHGVHEMLHPKAKILLIRGRLGTSQIAPPIVLIFI